MAPSNNGTSRLLAVLGRAVVAAHLDAHPEILEAERLTDVQLRERRDFYRAELDQVRTHHGHSRR
jgi:hypothetical protein